MEGNVPKIYRVKDPDPIPSKHPPVHPHLPQIEGFGGGALVLMISPVKTGKSTIISNLLLNEDFYNAQERFDETYIISNTIANDITSRYVRQAFTTFDHYDDSIIDGIVAKQKSFETKEEMEDIAIILDDCLGSIPQNSSANALASRFRHVNARLYLLSSQKFTGAVSPVIRANATNIIIGSPFPNQAELKRIADEYGDLFGGEKRFLEIYRKATPNRYDFLHLDLQSNPPKAYHNFEKLVAEGQNFTEMNEETDEETDEE
tara:strand:+ start:201 stop:983 length:783 start_codon:yes stop_codon:yes gene_type:complete